MHVCDEQQGYLGNGVNGGMLACVVSGYIRPVMNCMLMYVWPVQPVRVQHCAFESPALTQLAIFLTTYIVVVAWVLLQVSVAVLLVSTSLI